MHRLRHLLSRLVNIIRIRLLNTLATHLLRILGLELAVLVKAVRLSDGVVHDVENVGGLLEDVVHFFERAVARLGVEEPYDGEDDGVALTVSIFPLSFCVSWK